MMAKKRTTAATAAADATRILSVHDKWERDQVAKDEARFDRVEAALIQINHFTEGIERLDLPAWKADISADVRWLKWFLGGTSLAALGQLVVSLIRGG